MNSSINIFRIIFSWLNVQLPCMHIYIYIYIYMYLYIYIYTYVANLESNYIFYKSIFYKSISDIYILHKSQVVSWYLWIRFSQSPHSSNRPGLGVTSPIGLHLKDNVLPNLGWGRSMVDRSIETNVIFLVKMNHGWSLIIPLWLLVVAVVVW